MIPFYIKVRLWDLERAPQSVCKLRNFRASDCAEPATPLPSAPTRVSALHSPWCAPVLPSLRSAPRTRRIAKPLRRAPKMAVRGCPLLIGRLCCARSRLVPGTLMDSTSDPSPSAQSGNCYSDLGFAEVLHSWPRCDWAGAPS